jgi:hypothetical protein
VLVRCERVLFGSTFSRGCPPPCPRSATRDDRIGADQMIRRARQDDAAALVAIYAPYVERTWISFDEVPPSAEDMRAKTACGHPKLSMARR